MLGTQVSDVAGRAVADQCKGSGGRLGGGPLNLLDRGGVGTKGGREEGEYSLPCPFFPPPALPSPPSLGLRSRGLSRELASRRRLDCQHGRDPLIFRYIMDIRLASGADSPPISGHLQSHSNHNDKNKINYLYIV